MKKKIKGKLGEIKRRITELPKLDNNLQKYEDTLYKLLNNESSVEKEEVERIKKILDDFYLAGEGYNLNNVALNEDGKVYFASINPYFYQKTIILNVLNRLKKEKNININPYDILEKKLFNDESNDETLIDYLGDFTGSSTLKELYNIIKDVDIENNLKLNDLIIYLAFKEISIYTKNKVEETPTTKMNYAINREKEINRLIIPEFINYFKKYINNSKLKEDFERIGLIKSNKTKTLFGELKKEKKEYSYQSKEIINILSTLDNYKKELIKEWDKDNLDENFNTFILKDFIYNNYQLFNVLFTFDTTEFNNYLNSVSLKIIDYDLLKKESDVQYWMIYTTLFNTFLQVRARERMFLEKGFSNLYLFNKLPNDLSGALKIIYFNKDFFNLKIKDLKNNYSLKTIKQILKDEKEYDFIDSEGNNIKKTIKSYLITNIEAEDETEKKELVELLNNINNTNFIFKKDDLSKKVEKITQYLLNMNDVGSIPNFKKIINEYNSLELNNIKKVLDLLKKNLQDNNNNNFIKGIKSIDNIPFKIPSYLKKNE